jgi:DNA-binding MarR family transcriptional regulator
LEFSNHSLSLYSCLNNYMPNNQFKKGELYSFITGKASTAIADGCKRILSSGRIEITIEQWSVLYHLWKEDGQSQQQLCDATFRDKPSITRLVDNLEKLGLVKRMHQRRSPDQYDLPYARRKRTAGETMDGQSNFERGVGGCYKRAD